MSALAARPRVSRPVVALTRFLPWAPAAIGVVYAVVFVGSFGRLVQRVYWDADAASATMIAQTLGRGGMADIERFGWFVSLWFALLTRSLPFHRQLWYAAPTCFALLSVAALAWVSFRLAGRWAAAMTAVIGVAVAPVVAFDRVTLNFHSATWVASVVAGLFCIWLVRGPSARPAIAVGVLVAAFAGASLASDALFAVVGLVPMAVSGVVCLVVLRRRLAGVIALAVSVLAVPVAWGVSSAMATAGVIVLPRAPLGLATPGDILPDAARFLGLVAEDANGVYLQSGLARPALSGGYLVSLACSVLGVLALAAPFALLRQARRGPVRSSVLAVWAVYWAACIGSTAAAFALTVEGTHRAFYTIGLVNAVAATVPIVLAPTARRRLIGGLAISVVAGASLLNLLAPTALPPLASVEHRIVEIATAEHAPIGYTIYFWDASPLSWMSHQSIRVAPLEYCRPNVLCPFYSNVVSSWYRPRQTRSFLLRDTALYGHDLLPLALGRPSATFRLSSEFTLYVFPFDIASRLDDSSSVWAPSLSYGSGFNSAEQFDGLTSRWLIQDGELEVHAGVPSRVTLTGVAWSNGIARQLQVVDGTYVLARLTIPTYAVPISLGPLSLPAGTSRLSLVARPGPEPLGPNDPRLASVFLEPFTIVGRPS